MIEKLVRDDRAVQVRFVVPAVMADGEVTVAGEFNGWDTDATPLRGDGEVRTATMVLEPGHKYEFRYCVNGAWFNDDAADGYEPNEFGGHNGVIDLTEGS